ncbi:GNAT family N-acetyltransferase [Frankia sp. R82]|uniref:GNAT family N-acetyltransferase n=1 Tax=Frankia sp. R82 TaxID=2950553 RepID=UPI002043A7F8|nr:GNAT family protein [Frankia sp. R82]MCM3886717.1 GNAT family N-acetyltransferase [Frankia sp. R82]
MTTMSGEWTRPVLTGRHVRLEPLRTEHCGDLLRAASADRRSFTFTWVPDSDPAMRSYVSTALADRALGLAVPLVIRRLDDGPIVGATRFFDLGFWRPTPRDGLDEANVYPDDSAAAESELPSVAEIGHTWLAAAAQRTAINTEAKLLLLEHAFTVWSTLRVCLKTDVRNARSRAAIERLGAHFEGVRRAHMLGADGSARDTAYYSITVAEWPAVRAGLLDRLDRTPSPSGDPGS